MPRKEPKPTPAENTSPTSRIVEGRPGSVEGDIDQRMANLLRDHQEMGARPKQEPPSDRPVDISSVPDTADTAEGRAPKKATKKALKKG